MTVKCLYHSVAALEQACIKKEIFFLTKRGGAAVKLTQDEVR
jgi:hypothetical protein